MTRKNKPTIGVDLMGNENSPSVLFSHLLDFYKHHEHECNIIFFGDSKAFAKCELSSNYVINEEIIFMEDNPLTAIRRKKNSSLITGLSYLKDGKIDAFVSAGNTGALMAGAKLFVSPIKGVIRPALIALLPTKKSPLAVLDVGANVTNSVEQLTQFAIIGTAFQNTRSIKKPKVGLLNIGEEEKKGTSLIQKAYQQLKNIASRYNFEFVGNIEGKEAFQGNVDVLITEGFSGNIFLKTAEGVANFILESIKNDEKISKNYQKLHKKLHYEEYPGALLSGIDGIIIKCHGYSSSTAIINGIKGALSLLEKDFLSNLKKTLAAYHN
jgi:glycerol-3-phosphate acyltransferase PlsX